MIKNFQEYSGGVHECQCLLSDWTAHPRSLCRSKWIDAIRAGQIRAGTRLPPVRELSGRLGVSLETVQKAYRHLQEGGWVESRPRHGTVVLSARSAPSPPSLERSEKDRLALLARIKEAAKQPGLYPVSGVSLPPEPIILDALKRIAARAVEEALRVETWEPFGFTDLRSRIQGLLAGRGIWAETPYICVTGGSQQAISLIADLVLGPDDVVGVPPMCYLPVKEALAKRGARVVPVRQDERGIDPDHLREVCRKEGLSALYAMPCAHYPTGESWDEDRKRLVLEIAEERNLLVIEDDYFGELYYTGKPLASLWSLAGAGEEKAACTVLYTTSFSTVLHPNLRMGVLLVPTRLTARFSRAKSLLDGTTPSVNQQLLLHLWNDLDFPVYLDRLRKRLLFARDALAESLANWLPPGCGYQLPRAGVCGWVHVPEPFDDIRFFERCLRENIFVMPDIAFALDVPQPGFQVKFGHLPPNVLDEAIRRIGRILAASMNGYSR
jgi:GntR family transcriptional regulator / MocR family aminotransferase